MDFFALHPGITGLLLIAGFAIFPRITLLVATAWGGVLWWLGLIFLPRVTVAVLATTLYWDTNPILCILAWFFAFGGESGEKGYAARRRRRKKRRRDED